MDPKKVNDALAGMLEKTFYPENPQLIFAIVLFLPIDWRPFLNFTLIAGLNAAALAIIATLKLQFAKSITLGTSISKIILEGPAKLYIVPAVESGIPPEYKKWALPLVTYIVKSFAIYLAWTLQRIMSAIHSALRGGNMCSDNILDYLTTMGYMKSELRNNMKLDTLLGPSE